MITNYRTYIHNQIYVLCCNKIEQKVKFALASIRLWFSAFASRKIWILNIIYWHNNFKFNFPYKLHRSFQLTPTWKQEGNWGNIFPKFDIHLRVETIFYKLRTCLAITHIFCGNHRKKLTNTKGLHCWHRILTS